MTARPADGWREQLRDLRDVIHAMDEDGSPVVVDDPGTEHGRVLVLVLGAHIRPKRES